MNRKLRKKKVDCLLFVLDGSFLNFIKMPFRSRSIAFVFFLSPSFLCTFLPPVLAPLSLSLLSLLAASRAAHSRFHYILSINRIKGSNCLRSYYKIFFSPCVCIEEQLPTLTHTNRFSYSFSMFSCTHGGKKPIEAKQKLQNSSSILLFFLT